MKKFKLNIQIIGVCLAVIVVFSRCDEKIEGLDKGGIILLTVRSDYDYSPVSNAEVTVYSNIDDWAYEINPIKSGKTNGKGEIILDNMKNREYFFDVRESSRNNWQYPYGAFAEKGSVNMHEVLISQNLNGIISDADGEQWIITKVTDELGNDVSDDPEYSHWINNVQIFEKAGYYASDEGSGNNPTQTEGSWWAWSDQVLYILLNGTDVHEYFISGLTTNSFVATYYNEDFLTVSLHYSRKN